MTSTFSLRGLPHFGLDSYRGLLRQVEVYEPDHLRGVVNYLERIGWAKWAGSEEFKFLRPFYRMLEKCLELSVLSGQRASEAIQQLEQGGGAGDRTEATNA